MTTIYRLTFDRNDWYKYEIDGTHDWSLPPLACEACGVWKVVGESYPTVDVDAVFTKRSRPIPTALRRTEFAELREFLSGYVDSRAPLSPGATFGPLTGRLKGKPLDFAWHEPWTMMIKASVVQGLQNEGVHMPAGVEPRLLSDRVQQATLIELEALPLLPLSEQSLSAASKAGCLLCGRLPSGFNDYLVDPDTVFPEDVDLCRARNNPATYLASERLALAIKRLALTGCILQELAIAGPA